MKLSKLIEAPQHFPTEWLVRVRVRVRKLGLRVRVEGEG
jgi:hypothetical protein